MTPETDFPDFRNFCIIRSLNGACMIIPREGDLIRLYVQLSDKDALDPITGRVDRSKIGLEKLLEVRYFRPCGLSHTCDECHAQHLDGKEVFSSL